MERWMTQFFTHIVALEVEVREVDGDLVLVPGHDLPNTVLVWRVQVRKGRTLQDALLLVDVAPAGVCKENQGRGHLFHRPIHVFPKTRPLGRHSYEKESLRAPGRKSPRDRREPVFYVIKSCATL